MCRGVNPLWRRDTGETEDRGQTGAFPTRPFNLTHGSSQHAAITWSITGEWKVNWNYRNRHYFLLNQQPKQTQTGADMQLSLSEMKRNTHFLWLPNPFRNEKGSSQKKKETYSPHRLLSHVIQSQRNHSDAWRGGCISALCSLYVRLLESEMRSIWRMLDCRAGWRSCEIFALPCRSVSVGPI